MKKNEAMVVLAMALMFVIGIAGSAFSEDAKVKTPASTPAVTTPAQSTTTSAAACAATCPNFANCKKDNKCASMEQCKKDGKCANMEKCKKDPRCAEYCKKQACAMKTATMSGCDPTKCLTMPNGCSAKAKAACKTSK
jgi:hypothetical protein